MTHGDDADEARQVESGGPATTIERGSGTFLGDPARGRGVRRSGAGVTLGFLDAPVGDVVRVLLGDVLGLNYVVDPQVTGSITLQSAEPVPKADVFALLDEALSMNGYTVVESNGLYSVLPVEDAQRRIRALRKGFSASRGPQGYGIWAVPMKFVSAQEMQQILEPFAPQGNIVRVDNARNLLLIAGTEQEVATLMDTIEVFDVDWMEGMSFGLFELTYVDAETVAGEVKEIFNAPGSPMKDLVRIIPLPRLNAVLVMTPRDEYLEQARGWIERLDRGRDKVNRRIHVYYVQHGKADDLVTSLGGILGGDGGAIGGGLGGDINGPGQTGSLAAGGDNDSGFGSGFGLAEENALTSAGNARASTPAAAFQANGARFYADNKNNAVLIFATAAEYELVLDALEKLDTPPLQVLIEATIVEVSLNEDLDFGVEWAFQQDNSSFDFSDAGVPAQTFPGFSYSYLGANVQVVLNALDTVTDVNVLSSPQLMVVNNETARLQVGDEVPVPVQSAVSVTDPDAPIVNSIQFKDSGVILEVTPRINKNGSVFMEIAQEVSDVVATRSSGIDAPTFQQRKITSTVIVNNGETIALGGLIRETTTRADSGVPVLKDIPLLGLAFQSSTDTLRRTELLIFITPRVIRDTGDVRATLEDLKRRMNRERVKSPLVYPWEVKPPGAFIPRDGARGGSEEGEDAPAP